MQNKIIIFIISLVVIVSIGFYSSLKNSYTNDFKIIEEIPFHNNSIAIIEEYDTTNFYYLSKDDLKKFKNGKFTPFLKTKRIYSNDIKLIVNNKNIIINIKESVYLYGDILHFQNLINDKNLKIYKIIMNIIK